MAGICCCDVCNKATNFNVIVIKVLFVTKVLTQIIYTHNHNILIIHQYFSLVHD